MDIFGPAKAVLLAFKRDIGYGNAVSSQGIDQHFGLDVQMSGLEWYELGNPRNVRMALERDGVLVFDETVVPTYDEWYANGPECDDEPCRSAAETIAF